MSNGGTDSVALKGFFGGGSVSIKSDSVGEARDDERPLVWVEGVQEWVILQPALLEVFLEDPKSPSMLGVGLGGGC